MDCVNHPGVNAAAYCQNCGKAMCAECVRQEPGGQVLCEPCRTAWQGVRVPFAEPPMGGPNPAVAALLGFIPGVGAMYNGQFLKGFIHVAIFAVLVSASHHFKIFGLFIAAWIIYQVFEAHHTARARRDGEPIPDPLGLNELASWFHTGMQAEFRRGQGAPVAGQPSVPGSGVGPGAGSGFGSGSGQAPPAGGSPYSPPYPNNPYQGGYQPPPFAGMPYPPAGGYPPPPSAGYRDPRYQGAGYPGPGYPGSSYPGSGFPGGYPPGPPVPPMHWRRREPIAAIVLIALGVLFLLGQWDWISDRLFEYGWPVVLIGLGVWLIIRRMQDSRRGPLPPGAQPGPPGSYGERAQEAEKEPRGGIL